MYNGHARPSATGTEFSVKFNRDFNLNFKLKFMSRPPGPAGRRAG